MAIEKKTQKQDNAGKSKSDSFWRKPINLDSFENEDPLATLYRGREAVGENVKTNKMKSEIEKLKTPVAQTAKPADIQQNDFSESEDLTATKTSSAENENQENIEETKSSKISESALKNILRIKSETFHFTDLREILRGKSFEIYAYLRFLAGEEKVCKIKHLDLMKILDISRPTLFKQGEWLMRLNLIEKRSVPGDHLGTTYSVHRLEDILPVPANLIKQLETQIELFRQSEKTLSE